MTHTDLVIKAVWLAKEANARKHKNLADYMAYLRKQGKRKHAAGRITAPTASPAKPA